MRRVVRSGAGVLAVSWYPPATEDGAQTSARQARPSRRVDRAAGADALLLLHPYVPSLQPHVPGAAAPCVQPAASCVQARQSSDALAPTLLHWVHAHGRFG